jgi:glucosyl-3-phosphoglycerate synthase
MDRQLEEFGRTRTIGLVLPALYSEFKAPATRQIVADLAHTRYLKGVVVTLGRASYAEYRRVRGLFGGSPLTVTFLCIDGDRMRQLFALLEEKRPLGRT